MGMEGRRECVDMGIWQYGPTLLPSSALPPLICSPAPLNQAAAKRKVTRVGEALGSAGVLGSQRDVSWTTAWRGSPNDDQRLAEGSKSQLGFQDG